MLKRFDRPPALTRRNVLGVWCAVSLGLVGCTWDWDDFAAPSPARPDPAAWELVFQEECSGTEVATERWQTEYIGTNRTSKFRRYGWSDSWVLDENVTLGEGLCRIRIGHEPAGDAQFTSGALDSTNKFETQYGFFEVRLKAAAGRGISTVVALQNPERWPPQINLVSVEGARPTVARVEAWWRMGEEAARAASHDTGGSDFTAGFHTFGLEWTPVDVISYVDGAAVGDVTEAAPHMNTAMRILITAHVKGDDPGVVDLSGFPGELLIDWLRVYRRKP